MAILKYLIEKRANINAQDKKERTPIFYAIVYDNIDILKYLIKSGANINTKDKTGLEPIDYAIKRNIDMIKELIESGANIHSNLLHSSVYINNIDLLKYLIKSGADINGLDKKGRTPFHYALIYNNINIAKYLIENGAKINVQDNDGKRPLYYSIIRNNNNILFLKELIKELIKSGADINIEDINLISDQRLKEEILEIIKLDRDLYITYLFNRQEGIENGIDKSKDESIESDEEKKMLHDLNIIPYIHTYL